MVNACNGAHLPLNKDTIFAVLQLPGTSSLAGEDVTKTVVGPAILPSYRSLGYILSRHEDLFTFLLANHFLMI